jgi:hypothetical protein
VPFGFDADEVHSPALRDKETEAHSGDFSPVTMRAETARGGGGQSSPAR